MSRLEALTDLEYAMEYNPQPFTIQDVKAIRAYILGEPDEGSWEWVVELFDGSMWYLTGWCDYTGWDCRSDLVATKMENAADLFRTIRNLSRDADTIFEMLDRE